MYLVFTRIFHCRLYIFVDLVKRGVLTLVGEIRRYGNDSYDDDSYDDDDDDDVDDDVSLKLPWMIQVFVVVFL